MNKLINYLKETRSELLEVTWPTKAQTIAYALIVIAISAVVAVFLGGVDFSLKSALAHLLNK